MWYLNFVFGTKKRPEANFRHGTVCCWRGQHRVYQKRAKTIHKLHPNRVKTWLSAPPSPSPLELPFLWKPNLNCTCMFLTFFSKIFDERRVFRCVFVLILSFSVFLSGIFLILPRHFVNSGFNAKESINLGGRSTYSFFFCLNRFNFSFEVMCVNFHISGMIYVFLGILRIFIMLVCQYWFSDG